MRPRRLAALLSLLACNAPTPGATDTATSTTTTTTTSSTADATSTLGTADVTTTSTSAIDPTTSTTSEGCSFLDCDVSTAGHPCPEGDPWTPDCCPEGQKSVAWSNDGSGFWNATKCVEVAGDPVPVDGPCKLEIGPTSGIDNCEAGATCWYVDLDTLTGTCVPFCHGTPDAPDCSHAPGTRCFMEFDRLFGVCIAPCDPLLQDCPGDATCVPGDGTDAFFCVLDASGDEGQVFDPCSHVNACDPGLVCVDAALAVECDPMTSWPCCLPLCDLDAPPTCPGAGQQCVPWFDVGNAPAGLENLGVCALP